MNRLGCLVAALLALASARAAAHPTASLEYRRPESSDCPDQAALAAQVKQRLGYDPFLPGAERVVRAAIERAAGGLVATVELRGREGAVLGTRSIASPTFECAELAQALVLAVCIAIDP